MTAPRGSGGAGASEAEVRRGEADMAGNVKLTEPQRRALAYIVANPGANPSMIGQAMMDGRETRTNRTAQGYGRIGGNMVARLRRDGLVYSSDPNGWPRYSANAAGRRAMALLNPTAEGDRHDGP